MIIIMRSSRVMLLFIVVVFFSSCQTEGLNETTTMDDEPLVGKAVGAHSVTQPYIKDGSDQSGVPWVEVWSDEFDGSVLDKTKWNVSVSSKSRTPRKGANQDIRDWRWVERLVNLNGQGQLVLSVEKVGKHRMECGSVESRDKYAERYGYFEARIKVAQTEKGSHTAFWLMSPNQGSIDGTANDGAEIDVFESAWIGDYTKSVIHIDGYGKHHRANTKRYVTPGIHDGYHIFGMDWSKDKIVIYYDGKKTVTYHGDWVPKVKEFLWLSVGASFGDGNFQAQDKGRLTEAMVDYVRVFKKKYFRLVNKKTGKTFRILGEDEDVVISQSPNHAKGAYTQWAIRNTEKGYFYFINKFSNKYMRPQTRSVGAKIVQKNTSFGGAWTQWEMVNSDNGYVYIVNRETHKLIRPESMENEAAIILANRSDTSDWTQWKMELVED